MVISSHSGVSVQWEEILFSSFITATHASACLTAPFRQRSTAKIVAEENVSSSLRPVTEEQEITRQRHADSAGSAEPCAAGRSLRGGSLTRVHAQVQVQVLARARVTVRVRVIVV